LNKVNPKQKQPTPVKEVEATPKPKVEAEEPLPAEL
jgi:hypothetical protein